MPKAVVIGICVVVILVAIGVIWKREGEARRRRIREEAALDGRPPAELICKFGNFRFKWPYGQSTIDIYLILEMGIPDRLMGHLETVTPEGEFIDYHWEPFNTWCRRFVAEMGRAKLPSDLPACRECGNQIGELHTLECPNSGIGPHDHPPKKPRVVETRET